LQKGSKKWKTGVDGRGIVCCTLNVAAYRGGQYSITMKTLKTDDTPKTSDLFSTKERNPTVTPSVSLKGSVFTLPVLKLASFDFTIIAEGLQTHLANALEFFRHAPVVVDLAQTHELPNNCEFTQLGQLLKQHQLVCVAVQNGTTEQHAAATAAGLAVLTGQLKLHPKYPQVPSQSETETSMPSATAASASKPTEHVSTREPEANSQGGVTKVVSQPIRSGQRIYARGGDLILLAAANAGAEIMADGNIHIYAPLRGRALAGVSGDSSARIFCHSLEAELVAVAGSYRVFEDVIPEDINKKSVQIYLDGEQLKISVIE
jgi:septum site-determining protein MinC